MVIKPGRPPLPSASASGAYEGDERVKTDGTSPPSRQGEDALEVATRVEK